MPGTANTPEEFFDKYKSKKFRAENAGLCIILEYTYRLYKINTQDDTSPENLYAPEKRAKIARKAYESGNERAIWFYNGMDSLMKWIPTARDSASAARSSAIMSITSEISTLTNLLFAEKSISEFSAHHEETGEEMSADRLEIKLDFEAHEDELVTQFNKTREYIENILCYINAYNTLINCIAEEINVPEFSNFIVSTEPIEETLSILNSSLDKFRASPMAERFDSIMNINPILMIPSPIPEKNLKNATASINWAMYHGDAWSNTLTDMTANYWGRAIPNG